MEILQVVSRICNIALAQASKQVKCLLITGCEEYSGSFLEPGNLAIHFGQQGLELGGEKFAQNSWESCNNSQNRIRKIRKSVSGDISREEYTGPTHSCKECQPACFPGLKVLAMTETTMGSDAETVSQLLGGFVSFEPCSTPQNLDTVFCGLYSEEVAELEGKDLEYLKALHSVPVLGSIVKFRSKFVIYRRPGGND